MIVISTMKELPENCESCPCYYTDCGVTECNLTKEDVGKYNPRNWKYKDKRPDNCPLVKI